MNERFRTRFLAAIGGAAAMVYLLADRFGGGDWLHRIAKPIPVLALACWVGALPRKDRYQTAVIIGLLLSALGDILLELSHDVFLLGLIAFLLGHVAYSVAFTQDCRRLCLTRAGAAYAYGVLAYAFLLGTGNMGAMAIPAALYVIVISTMAWRAVSRIGAPAVPDHSARAGLIGALLFVASDSILSFRMFGTPIQWSGIVVMTAYWLGQLGIAVSAQR